MRCSQLTHGQRCHIEALDASGFTQAEIAERVGVHYSSWQRGTNEWLNGRLRRCFPKGTSLLDEIRGLKIGLTQCISHVSLSP